MERLGSLFWSGVTMVALLGMVSSIAAPLALASPIVKITDPGHEQVVRGEIVIDVSYRSDSDQPITRIDLLIDDEIVSQYAVNPPSVSGTQAFKWTFDSPNGSKHSIGARAVDAAGETGMASITVTVASAESSSPAGQDRIPPVINIYYPAQGAEVAGEVEIKAEATDNEGVMAVFFYLDGKFHTAIMNTGPYTARWDTTKMSDGPHVIQGKVMDRAENESASAEVTVFVKNRDMTTASTESLAAPGAQPAAPSVGAQPGVTESQFATPSGPLMATATGDVQAEGARVGYVPAIGDAELSARTSSPRMISALPRDTQPEPAHQLATEEETAEALAVATTREPVTEHQIASTELAPRLTVPRRLAATEQVVTPLTPAERATEPVGPQVAAVDSLQKMTLPRTEIAPRASTDAGSELRAELVSLDPILQVTPDPERVAMRTTTPGLSLTPVEQPTFADLKSFKPLEGDTDSMRIAVLPERASRAAIPADGRLTLPGEPTIAPVASMAFEQVKVLFDNETLEMLTPPEIAEGISIAPLREIFEHSDGVLYWYPVEKRVKATRAGTEMNLQIGDPRVEVNNETRTLQVAPYIRHGRTMVPLQFLADTLDVTVTFNPESGQICLTSNDF